MSPQVTETTTIDTELKSWQKQVESVYWKKKIFILQLDQCNPVEPSVSELFLFQKKNEKSFELYINLIFERSHRIYFALFNSKYYIQKLKQKMDSTEIKIKNCFSVSRYFKGDYH